MKLPNKKYRHRGKCRPKVRFYYSFFLLSRAPQIEKEEVIITELEGRLGGKRRELEDFVAKHIKELVSQGYTIDEVCFLHPVGVSRLSNYLNYFFYLDSYLLFLNSAFSLFVLFPAIFCSFNLGSACFSHYILRFLYINNVCIQFFIYILSPYENTLYYTEFVPEPRKSSVGNIDRVPDASPTAMRT